MFVFHQLKEFLDTLNEFSIIVEGKRDVEALRRLGISRIFDVSGRSLDEFVEALPEDEEYVILVDFDGEGRELERIIKRLMTKRKITVNSNLRLRFKDFFDVTKIEELIKFSKLKEDVYNGKVSSIDYEIFNRSKFYRKWYSRKARCDWGDIRPN